MLNKAAAQLPKSPDSWIGSSPAPEKVLQIIAFTTAEKGPEIISFLAAEEVLQIISSATSEEML